MKKINLIGSLFVWTILFVACSKGDNLTEHSSTFVLTLHSDVARTTLQASSIIWEEDDRLCCLATYDELKRHSLYKDLAPVLAEGNSARIELTCGSAFTPRYFVYPSSESVSLDMEQNLIQLSLPSSYVCVKGNIPKASNISIGEVKGNEVFMRNILTLIKFEINSDNIVQVKLASNAGEALCGNLYYNPATLKTESVEGSDTIVLLPPDGESVFLPGEYYVPVPAVRLSKGLRVTLIDNSDLSAQKVTDKAVELIRNHILNIGKEADWSLVFESSTKIVRCLIHDGASLVNGGWPFVGSRPGISTVCGKGLSGPYYLEDYPDAAFYFYIAANKGSDSWRSTNGSGFRFGGSVHDYMLLPSFPDFRLVSVYVRNGGKAIAYAITDNPATGEPKELAGGKSYTVPSSKDYTFTLSDTEKGVAYRLDLPTTNFAALYEIVLTYDKL